jgi:hypothetical protein
MDSSFVNQTEREVAKVKKNSINHTIEGWNQERTVRGQLNLQQ